jgi:hypothetical protein
MIMAVGQADRAAALEPMLTAQLFFTNALWIVGLAGVLATFSYMAWYRSARGWRWSRVFSLPRMLIPLSVCLELFSIGMAINGITATQPAPWWEIAAWSILALIFAVQTVIYGVAGFRHGWDTPLEERGRDE